LATKRGKGIPVIRQASNEKNWIFLRRKKRKGREAAGFEELVGCHKRWPKGESDITATNERPGGQGGKKHPNGPLGRIKKGCGLSG